MSSVERVLTPNEILAIVPRRLITYVIQGVLKEHGLVIGVMLDKDEEDSVFSRGTGKVWISDDSSTGGRARYCTLLRRWADVVGPRCGVCDREHFEKVRKRVGKDPSYRGERYVCSAGGLLDFAIPIVEKTANSFVGVLFGGQKRLKRFPLLVGDYKYLRRLLAKPENHALRRIPFWKLFWNYLRVEAVTSAEFDELRGRCEQICDELAIPFATFVRSKRTSLDQELDREIVDSIDRLLDSARDLNSLDTIMAKVLDALYELVRVDWIMFMSAEYREGEEQSIEIRKVAGHGIGLHERVKGTSYVLGEDQLLDLAHPVENPKFMRAHVNSIVSGEPKWWWIPLPRSDASLLGGFALGSAPRHRNTRFDEQHFRSKVGFLSDIARRVSTKYSELIALKTERQRTKQLLLTEQRLKTSIQNLEDTVLGITHQIKRPLIMITAALENVSYFSGLDSIDPRIKKRIQEHVELGMLAADHAELLNRGIAKAFAAEQGGEFKQKAEPIEAKAKLQELCEAMRKVSGRTDVSFVYFDESPTIFMDLNSFLYVFYALVDNALKYSDERERIHLGCDMERRLGRYALKVKSFGIPIDDKSIVFEKFKRGEKAWQYDETGVGLGCWSAREHMRRMGGDILLETRDRMSVFIVVVPTQEPSFSQLGGKHAETAGLG